MKKLFILIVCISVLLAGCAPAEAALPTPVVGQATLPPGAMTATAPVRNIFQYPESDTVIRLAYDPALVGRVEGRLVPTIGNTPDQAFYVTHPAFVQVRFPDYASSQLSQQPFVVDVPQMMVFRTQDFAGYGGDSPYSFSNQLSQLEVDLQKGIEPDRCAKPHAGSGQPLPFLPMANAVQVFCAKPQLFTFDGGRGIRYVTYYDQGPAPKVDWRAFYTFQGLSNDGAYYISVILPVRTNVLPTEAPVLGPQPDLEALAFLLQDQLTKINAQPDDQFTPSLMRLDGLIAGVSIPGD